MNLKKIRNNSDVISTHHLLIHHICPTADDHEVVVRATDGTSTLQPKESSQAFPSGLTGWVSVEVDPDAL